jgi:hypothetical protein
VTPRTSDDYAPITPTTPHPIDDARTDSSKSTTARIVDRMPLRTTLGMVVWYTGLVLVIVGSYLRLESKVDSHADTLLRVTVEMGQIRDALIWNRILGGPNGGASMANAPSPSAAPLHPGSGR